MKFFRGTVKLNKLIKKKPINFIYFIGIDIGSANFGFINTLKNMLLNKIYAIDIKKFYTYKIFLTKKIDILDEINILNIFHSYFHPRPQILTIDVSFKSVRGIIKNIIPILSAKSSIYILVKSQFELNIVTTHKIYRYIFRMIFINIIYFFKIKFKTFLIDFFVINIKINKNSIEYWINIEVG